MSNKYKITLVLHCMTVLTESLYQIKRNANYANNTEL